MPDQPVTLITLFTVDPGRQAALVALLRENTETVIRTLPGWQATRIIAAQDGTRVVICSDWGSAAAVDAMRSDPRMMAYFPKITALAGLTSILGAAVVQERAAP